MTFDSRKLAIAEHKRWIGYLQPDGIVVAPVALVDFGAQLDASSFTPLHERFLAAIARDEDGAPTIPHFAHFARSFLGWKDTLLDIFSIQEEIPAALTLSTGDTSERPDAAYRHLAPADPERPWMLLIRQLPHGTSLDAIPDDARASGWVASPAQKFERLLRATDVPIGILANGTDLRLIYAPRGENAGSLTFPLRFMASLPGRAVVTALDMLLGHGRLITVAEARRLPSLLKKSREYQGAVSTQLADQVLTGLYDLVRGFQSADALAKGTLLRQVLARDPDEIYHGLLTFLLRLVFLLFAEDRGLMPGTTLYVRGYSIHGLFEKLRAAHERYPDTMDARFGAYAQILSLCRLVHDGCRHGELAMPARQGHLFDPHRFPFLEGRNDRKEDIRAEGHQLPLVSDGTLFRVLEKLLLLDGERLSYRALDVEQIGSVYQTMIGFTLQTASGVSIALKPAKTKGAPAFLDLDALLHTEPAKRAEHLQKLTDHKLTGKPATALKEARTHDDLLAALDRKIARAASPDKVPPGSLILQPTDERRRSGSHYTPRALTAPIVKKTLEPILARLSGMDRIDRIDTVDAVNPVNPVNQVHPPTPQQILDLKVCDPAVGSGAFLVEACRQLGDALVAAWQHHGGKPVIPPDEDELLHARRLVAQRCLYGLDRNPMATDLAKLSLWLATLAKDHPFTFLDHSLRTGDALVGLGKKQILAFHWDLAAPEARQRQLGQHRLEQAIERAASYRREILEGGDLMLPGLKATRLGLADEALRPIRQIADLCIAAYFHADKPKTRTQTRERYLDLLLEAEQGFQPDKLRQIQATIAALRGEKRPSQGTFQPSKDTQQPPQGTFQPSKDTPQPLMDANFSLKGTLQPSMDANLLSQGILQPSTDANFLSTGTLQPSKDTHEASKSTRGPSPGALGTPKSASQEQRALSDEPTAAPFAHQSAINSPHPVTPFHWEIEFPEVFARENGGFDAFIGNPPYGGKNTVIEGNHESYLDWLKTLHAESHGNADLVAHFFRRAFNLLRRDGTFGLIATNTIRQGDTRHTGLRWICMNGGTIYAARRRYKWVGEAAVVVSVVWVVKGTLPAPFDLDGQSAPIITAYLFHDGGHENPASLGANVGKSFIGSFVLGMGFTFDDTDKKGVASSLSEMKRLIAKDPRNAERIFPYLGGEEVNDSPTHSHRRYVINFGDFPLLRDPALNQKWITAEDDQRAAWLRTGIAPEDYPNSVAADWPDLLEIVERKVRPERLKQASIVNPDRWWKFARSAAGFYEATRDFQQALVCPIISNKLSFAFVPLPAVVSHKLCAFPFQTFAAFSILQSRCHELWAIVNTSTMKDDLNYAPTDCFETFPFPAGWETDAALEAAGREYYEARAALMVANQEGLTKTYNRFHDPAEDAPGIHRLRRLHAALDQAVLAAYGWSDLVEGPSRPLEPQRGSRDSEAEGAVPAPLPTAASLSTKCEFLPDYYDEPEQEGGDPIPKSIRHRWPDATRDEVLARLLKLNATRAAEERGATVAPKTKPAKPKKTKVTEAAPLQRDLIPPPQRDLFDQPAPSAPVRQLPTTKRLREQDPHIYATALVAAILHEAHGPLRWHRLRAAFIVATTPSLMLSHALPDEKARVAGWRKSWNQLAGPEHLLQAIRNLGSKNLAVTKTPAGEPIFELQDGGVRDVEPHVGYDAWLALHVTGVLAEDVELEVEDFDFEALDSQILALAT